MERNHIEQRMRPGIGVRQRLRQGERLLTPLQGLVWIAEHPQGQGCIGKACHPGSGAEDQSVVAAAGVVEGNSLLQVGTGRDEVAQRDTRYPPGMVGLQEEGRVVLALGQGEELLRQRPCDLELPPVSDKIRTVRLER